MGCPAFASASLALALALSATSGAQVGSAAAPPPAVSPTEQASDAPPQAEQAERVREGPSPRTRAASSSRDRREGIAYGFIIPACICVYLLFPSRKRKRRDEMRIKEVSMSDASPDYEYKILRDLWGFGRLEGGSAKRKRALANEVKFGWELHEQIDSDRIRLRRDRSCRGRDDPSLGDPYRTYAVFK